MRGYSKAYQFTAEELQVAQMQLQETRDAVKKLRSFLEKTADVAGDALALQRASAFKTIHHLEAQIAEWIQNYPRLDVQ